MAVTMVTVLVVSNGGVKGGSGERRKVLAVTVVVMVAANGQHW